MTTVFCELSRVGHLEFDIWPEVNVDKEVKYTPPTVKRVKVD